MARTSQNIIRGCQVYSGWSKFLLVQVHFGPHQFRIEYEAIIFVSLDRVLALNALAN